MGAHLTGFFGILHTWGRQMQYHPHLHFVVPAGGLAADRNDWRPSRNAFYLPVKALAKLFRGLFRAEMHKHGLFPQIDSAVWTMDWNVNCQALPESEGAIKYLASYVFRVAIADSRIVHVADGQVTFSYRKQGSRRPRKTTLDAFEFIRRFLQHVLPSGFMKVRHYGFLNANCAVSLSRIKLLILAAAKDRLFALAELLPPRFSFPTPTPTCRICGGPLVYLYSIVPSRPWRGPP